MSITGVINAVAIAALVSSGCSNSKAHDGDDNKPASPAAAAMANADQMFVENAVASGQREVEQARMAQANAANPAVKEYAARLLAAHTAEHNELAALIERKQISINGRTHNEDRGSIGARNDATASTKLGGATGETRGQPNPTGTTGASGTVATTGEAKDRERAGMTYPWMHATGPAFDEGYVGEQIKAHQDAIGLFDQQSKIGTDAELKAFAAKQLPVLREHLREAETLQRSLRPNP